MLALAAFFGPFLGRVTYTYSLKYMTISKAMLRQIFQEIIDTLKALQRPEGESSDSPAERQVS